MTKEERRIRESYRNWLVYWDGAPWIERLVYRYWSRQNCQYWIKRRGRQCSHSADYKYTSAEGPIFFVCSQHLMKWLYSLLEKKRTLKYLKENPPPWSPDYKEGTVIEMKRSQSSG